MNKIDWVRKLTSRKFWMAVANFVSMMIVALGGTESEAAQITALVIGGATVLAYIIGEGLVDASNADSDAVKTIAKIEQNKNEE